MQYRLYTQSTDQGDTEWRLINEGERPKSGLLYIPSDQPTTRPGRPPDTRWHAYAAAVQRLHTEGATVKQTIDAIERHTGRRLSVRTVQRYRALGRDPKE